MVEHEANISTSCEIPSEIKGAYHLSELNVQPVPIVMTTSLSMKTNHPHQSSP